MATTQSTQHKETHSRKHLVEDDTMEVSERWDFIQKNSYKMLEITCLRSNSIAHKYSCQGYMEGKSCIHIKHLSFFYLHFRYLRLFNYSSALKVHFMRNFVVKSF